MKKNISIIFFITLAAILISCGGGSSKQTKSSSSSQNKMTGTMTGLAKIYDNDVALARDRAIDDAMNKLVKQKLGTTISGRSIVEDFALVESIVEARSTGMVKDWNIVNEWSQDGHYWVKINGTVYPKAVEDTIRQTIENYGRPRFMCLIKESFDGKLNMPGLTVTELEMMNIMGDVGFEFVDAAMTQQLLQKERSKMQKAMNGQVSGDVQSLLLDDAGAEVIIIGEAKTTDQSAALAKYNTNMKSKSAIINLKAIDVYTGRILASVSAQAPGAHINPEAASRLAIKRALKKSNFLGTGDKTGDFINRISKKFLVSATRRVITLNISGLDYKDMKRFRDVLSQRVRGISKVYSRGTAGKYAKLEVQFAGKTTDLADELQGKAESLGFEIVIKETYPNRIMIEAKRIK